MIARGVRDPRVLAALRQNRGVDYGVMTIAILGVCIPTFVTAPLLVLVFASKFGWLPSAGWNDGALVNLVLPVTVLALPQIAIISRLTRAGMAEQGDVVDTLPHAIARHWHDRGR